MRKTSTYARKRLHHTPKFNGVEWLNTIGRCRPYTAEPVPGSWLPGTSTIADHVLAMARLSFERIKVGTTRPDNTEDHDMLAHILGVGMLRAIQIAGDDRTTNPMLPILDAATDAMRRLRERYESQHRWGWDGPALAEMADALDVYQTIIEASSPQQMADATDLRIEILKRRATP